MNSNRTGHQSALGRRNGPSSTPVSEGSRAEYPAVDVEPAALLRETPYVRGVLARHDVRERDLSDVAQEVFIVAWKAIRAGYFRPPPDLALPDALRPWLFGIARRQASIYRRVAHRRYECFASAPWEAFIIDPATENRVDARTHLKLFERVPRKLREVLELIAFGAEPIEAARELGISREASLARIRNGREQFRRAIARWRRGRGSQ